MLHSAARTVRKNHAAKKIQTGVSSCSDAQLSVSDAQPYVDADDLQKTFKQFNKLALRLQTSQIELKNQLETLQDQLVAVDRQRLEELTAKEILAKNLQQLLEVLPVGVVVLDATGIVRTLNPAALRIIGRDLLNCSWREGIEKIFAPKRDDGHEISLTNGKRVRLATQSLLDQGQIIVIDDLTETRQLQKKLEQSQRLSLLGKTAASLAHQIRTPLSAMFLYVEDALLQVDDIDNTKQNLTRVKTKIQQLNQQVDDLLIFSRQDMPLTDQVDLIDLINTSIENVRGVSREKNIQLHANLHKCRYQLICQSSAMQGLLTNLLKNSLEASVDHTEVSIYVLPAEDLKHPLVVEIVDKGVGMSHSQLARLTEPFFTSKSTGTGLGLAIVKRIADAHHIDLQFVSEINKGTKVILSFSAINLRKIGEVRFGEEQ